MSEPDQLAVFALADEGAEWKPPPWPEGCPAIGKYTDISYEEYDAIPAIRASHLKLHTVSMKHVKAAMEGRMKTDSDARRFGRADHAYVIEGSEAFHSRFLVADRCAAVIKSGERKGQTCDNPGKWPSPEGPWFCGQHAPKGWEPPEDCIGVDELERIKKQTAAIIAHEVVKLLRSHGGSEVTLVWEREGLPCKARLDKLVPEPLTIVDLKKMQIMGGTDGALQKSIRSYGWDFQFAWYRQGVKAVLGEKAWCAWVFAEDNEPYDVRPVWASEGLLEIGRMKVERAWKQYKCCVETGEWPGYCDSIESLEPADFEAKQYGVNQ